MRLTILLAAAAWAWFAAGVGAQGYGGREDLVIERGDGAAQELPGGLVIDRRNGDGHWGRDAGGDPRRPSLERPRGFYTDAPQDARRQPYVYRPEDPSNRLDDGSRGGPYEEDPLLRHYREGPNTLMDRYRQPWGQPSGGSPQPLLPPKKPLLPPQQPLQPAPPPWRGR